MLLNTCNEDNNPVGIGLPDGFRRLNAAHALHLYIKKDNVKFRVCRKQFFSRGKITYIKTRIPLFYETANLLLGFPFLPSLNLSAIFYYN